MIRIFTDAAGVHLEDVEPPVTAAGQLGIRTAVSLISAGTELEDIDRARRGGPELRLGYCAAGIVDDAAGAPGFSPGDRVIAMGWGYALHAERICVPYRLCARLPPHVAFEHGVFACLAATAAHAVDRAGLSGTQDVLVVGAGLVGQLVARIAASRARRVIVVDPIAARITAAGSTVTALACAPDRIGDEVRAVTAGRGVDVVFLCSHGEATRLVRDCIGVLALADDRNRRGVIVAVGRLSAQLDLAVEMGNVDIRYAARCGAGYRDDDYAHGRIDVTPPAGEHTVTVNLATCVDAIAAGRLSVAELISHRVPLSRAAEAYQLLAAGQALGVVLEYGS